MSAKITHTPESERFAISDGHHRGYLMYAGIAEGQLRILGTYIQPKSRGRGLAGALVDHATQFAADEGLELVALCRFAQQYLEADR